MTALPRKGMKRLVILVSLMSAGILAVFLYSFRLSAENTTIDVMYMQYACGDCYVLYRVLRAGESGQTHTRTFDNESDTPMRFIGWKSVVLYKGSD